MSGRLSTSLAAGVILIGHWIIVPVLVTLPNYYSRFLRSKVASHAKPSMARVKGPSLHPTYMAESPGCESSQSGLRDGTFPLSFLFPSFASPGGVQGWKANNQRANSVPVGPSHIWVCLQALAQKKPTQTLGGEATSIQGFKPVACASQK